MGPIQKCRSANRANDMNAVDGAGHCLGKVSHLAGGIVEHANRHEFAGIERLGDRLLDSVRQSLLSNVDERILIVGEGPEMRALPGRESIGHGVSAYTSRYLSQSPLCTDPVPVRATPPHAAATVLRRFHAPSPGANWITPHSPLVSQSGSVAERCSTSSARNPTATSAFNVRSASSAVGK